MYDTILIPTDGSSHAVRAAKHGFHLAQAFDTSVHIINVVNTPSGAGRFELENLNEQFVTPLENEGKNAIETITGVADAHDSITTAIIRGKPFEAILEYADDHGADVIAMGTHGRTGLNRYIAGSVTERVVRLSEVPVLTVRATERSQITGNYEEILIPTDGSELVSGAIDHGLAIAEQTGARIHAVNIVDIGDVAFRPSFAPPMEIIDQLESKGETITGRIATEARNRGLDAVTEVQEGMPASDILEYADENSIDLITMGTAGRTGLDRYLIGSTTERVIRHADMPVLAVNKRNTDTS